MRLLISILALLAAIIGLVLSILPFGPIALIPLGLAFILGLLAFNKSKKEGKGRGIVNIVLLVTILGLGMSVYRSIFDTNEIEEDVETIQREQESEEEAIKELEDLEIEE